MNASHRNDRGPFEGFLAPFHPGALAALLLAALMIASGTAAPLEANRVAEVPLVSGKAYANPFTEAQLEAVVTQPDGAQLRVPGFWAGETNWRFRYASGKVGTHTWRTECSDTNNSGLHGVTGSIPVAASTSTNALFLHGPIRVASDQRHFEHADRRLNHLVDSGLVPAIVGAWGRGDCNSMEAFGAVNLKRHWRHLIARYGAYPVIWILAGEIADETKWGQGPWAEFAKYVREIDPYKHPLSCHTGQGRRGVDGDLCLVDYDMVGEITMRGAPWQARRWPFSPRPARRGPQCPSWSSATGRSGEPNL